ncbi:MAG: winged helix-turn-helix domain-containing protein [Acidimicrobiia bacterium]|nr:winged helix-turn-helix domain-containing protein [Acidimicrobiia bacterium]
MNLREVVGSVERYRIGNVTVDVATASATGPDGVVALYPQTFDLLVALIRGAPEVCRTVDLIEVLSPGGFVGDQNLKQRIYQLRTALGPLGVAVTTVRGIGYRLDVAVARLEPEARNDAAVAAYEQAVALVDGMEHGKAAALLEEVVRNEPGWVEPRPVLAWCYMWQGKQEQARHLLDEAVALSAAGGGEEDLLLKGVHASFAGDALEAIDRFEVALRRYPDGYWLRINLMGLYWLVGRYDAAGDLLPDLERIRPGFYMNSWQRAFHELTVAGDVGAAQEAFAEAHIRNPDIPLPLGDLMPALQLWLEGDLDAALRGCDELAAERLGWLSPTGADQLLTLRSRLLVACGDVEAAQRDQLQAAALFEPGSSLAAHHFLEVALLDDDEESMARLEAIAENTSSLLAAQSLGWLGIAAAQQSRADEAGDYRRRLARLRYQGEWAWGYPTRPAFDRAQAAFALLIRANVALAAGELEMAARLFSRALLVTPERWHVVPVIALDGRAHLAAREGLALAAAALGQERTAAEANRWLVEHRLETEILAQAGAGFRQRALARLG